MGLGPAQSRRIAAVETLPAILAVAVGGTVCALALVPLVGPAIDLAAFTGLPVTAPLHADALAILIAIGGLLLVAALTLYHPEQAGPWPRRGRRRCGRAMTQRRGG